MAEKSLIEITYLLDQMKKYSSEKPDNYFTQSDTTRKETLYNSAFSLLKMIGEL